MTRSPPHTSRSGLTSVGRSLVLTCFFLSGTAGLIFQVGWSKMLAVVLGSSIYAITAVVAAFMAGLGVGGLSGGAIADRIAGRTVPQVEGRTPGRIQKWTGGRPGLFGLYGLLEAAIGLFGLLSMLLVPGLAPVMRVLYDAEAAAASPLLAARFAVVFLVLLAPTFAMGCTLPLLVAFLQGHEPRFGRHVGRLYAFNTLGAVAGAWLAGFVLIPALGLRLTVLSAAAINLAVFAAVVLANLPEPGGGRVPVAESTAREPRTGPAFDPDGEAIQASVSRDEPSGTIPARAVSSISTVSRGTASAVLLVLGVSGALALVYEIVWTRLLAVVLGSSTYSFSTILGTFLVGIGAGSLVAAPFLLRLKRPVLTLALLQAALSISVIAGTALVPRLNLWYAQLLQGMGVGGGAVFGSSLLLASVLVLVPTLLLGAIFPLAVDTVHRSARGAGSSVGLAYGINTAGSIAGTVLAGFILMETLGAQNTLLGAGAVNLALAALLLAMAEGQRGRRALGAAALIALAPLPLLLAAPWPGDRINLGITNILRGYVRADAAAGNPALSDLSIGSVVFVREGRLATVVVSDGKDGHRTLWIGGKPDASTTGDLEANILLGHLPMLFASAPPRDVLIVGHGSGVTAGAVLTHPVGRVDSVEIEAAVFEASAFFRHVNNAPLLDARHRAIVEDGRTWLAYSGRDYDAIISEPSNPWIAGIGNLFTRDYYRQVESRLRGGGVFCQWLQLYETSDEVRWAIGRAFTEVFPDSEVFIAPGGSDAFLLARRSARPPAFARLAERMAPPAVAADLSRIGIADPFDLAPLYRGPFTSFLPEEDGPVNTDDNAFVEFRAPRDLFGPGESPTLEMPGDHEDLAARGLFGGLRRGEALAGIGRALVRVGLTQRAERLVERMTGEGMPEAAALREDYMAIVGVKEEVRPAFWDLREADAAAAAGDHLGALAMIEDIRNTAPRDPLIEFRYALALLRAGDDPGPDRERHLAAARALFGTLAGEPPASDDYESLINAAIADLALGRPGEALSVLDEAMAREPSRGDAYLYSARILRSLGEDVRAAEMILLGRQRAPGHPDLLAEPPGSQTKPSPPKP